MARAFAGGTDKIVATIREIPFGYTLACWVSPSAGVTAGLMRGEVGGNFGWTLQIDSTTLIVRAATGFATQNSDSISTTQLTAGVWQCVIATLNISDLKTRLYVGSKSTSMAEVVYSVQNAATGARLAGVTGLVLGNATAGNPLVGSLASPVISTNVWTADEMELYRRGRISLRGVQNLWPLGVGLEDQVSGANGTATGTSYVDDPIPFSQPASAELVPHLRPYPFTAARAQ